MPYTNLPRVRQRFASESQLAFPFSYLARDPPRTRSLGPLGGWGGRLIELSVSVATYLPCLPFSSNGAVGTLADKVKDAEIGPPSVVWFGSFLTCDGSDFYGARSEKGQPPPLPPPPSQARRKGRTAVS